MPPQMFLIHPRDRDSEDAREEIATFIAQRGGFILMATSWGSLIATFDDAYLEAVKHHARVDFAGGVSIDPSAPGAAALRQLFARNVAAQLVERGAVVDWQATNEVGALPMHTPGPPGFRPLTWSVSEPAASSFPTADHTQLESTEEDWLD
jgi:hypothetical protein